MPVPDIVDMLSTLVGTPSVSSTDPTLDLSNVKVVDHLANWLDDLGFEVKIQPLTSDSAKVNLVATKGNGSGGLVLAGHSDTVPCKEESWREDPFTLEERDGRLYGLGTCDMKGFFPLALAAAATFREADLVKPIIVVATSDEETGMAGARDLVANGGFEADAAIIGEPTNLIPVYAHKGIANVRVAIQGSAGHSSDPTLGNSSLDAMHTVMQRLIAFRGDLERRFQNPAFAVSTPTLNLGCLHAGDNPNRICEYAELLFDMRFLPRMDTSAILDEVKTLLATVEHETGTQITGESCFPVVEPYEGSPTTDLVRELVEHTGNAPGTIAFGTEAPFYADLGIETVVFGPGSVDQAHQADEFVRIDTLDPTRRVLARMIQKYCCRA